MIRRLVDALNARLLPDEASITATIDLAVLVATADGKIDKDEQAALTASLEKILGSRLDPALVRCLLRESRRCIRAVGPEARAKAIGELLAASDAVEEGLRLAIAIGCASDGLSAIKRERIALIARAAGGGAPPIDELASGLRLAGSPGGPMRQRTIESELATKS
jgi:hypothetical protein